MAPKVLQGSKQLSENIRKRRQELGLTVEEAASIANVGVKTWYRYESGESIRQDKYKGICRALNWRQPTETISETKTEIDYFKSSGGWSSYLEKYYGDFAAVAFASGSEMLLDDIKEDMDALSRMSKGTHVGQLDISWMKEMLPEQFLMEYDYEFLYKLKALVIRLRAIANAGSHIIANNVIEELVLYLIYEESEALMEAFCEENRGEEYELGREWLFEILDDMDIITCLYSDFYIDRDHMYHFQNWNEPFYS